ncbi:MAG TPA: hypothetical protein VH639_24470 [Bryobacteraceae bacterium]|jgi:hypothetical protein
MTQLKQHRRISREAEGDERLVRYLLHQLTPDEENAVEEQYFSDAALHERLLVVEDELIDSYVGGELRPDRRELFEEWFLRSPERREKVEIARSLASYAKSSADAAGRANGRSIYIFRNAMLAGGAAAVLLAGAFVLLRPFGGTKAPQVRVAKDAGPPPVARPVVAGPARTSNPTDERSKREAFISDPAKAAQSGARPVHVERPVIDVRPPGPKPEVAEVTPRVNAPVGPSVNLPQASTSSEVRGQLRPLPTPSLQLILHGKVVMQNASPPPGSAGIERVCSDPADSVPGPITDKNGEWLWRMEVDATKTPSCIVRAALRGYTSTEIDISSLNSYDDLKLVLTPSNGADSESPAQWTFVPLLFPPSNKLDRSVLLQVRNTNPLAFNPVWGGSCPGQEECWMVTFDMTLQRPIADGKLRWAADYIDTNNYALFEMDRETFWAKVVADGKIIDRTRVQLHHSRDTFRLNLEVTPNHIRTRIEEGGYSLSIDDWAEPGHDFTQGRIGMLADKN